jgi:hypothetical protein
MRFRCSSCGGALHAVRPLMEGEADVQVLWFRVRDLLTRNLDLDYPPSRQSRLAKIPHLGDRLAGRCFL